MNTYEVWYQLYEGAGECWVRIQADNIDDVSRQFKMNTYPFEKARILKIRKVRK